MSFFELFAFAVALAMDAFAVAVCIGCTVRRPTLRHYVRLAGTFGFFQFFMPVVGWYMGLTVRGLIASWDHWVAFGLLLWIGVSMLRSGWAQDDDTAPTCADPTTGLSLLLLAVATSIDALAVGLSFSLINMSIWMPAVLIGVVCAAITAGGLFCGRALAHARAFSKRAELFGGLVLIGIGGKILLEHGVFG